MLKSAPVWTTVGLGVSPPIAPAIALPIPANKAITSPATGISKDPAATPANPSATSPAVERPLVKVVETSDIPDSKALPASSTVFSTPDNTLVDPSVDKFPTCEIF